MSFTLFFKDIEIILTRCLKKKVLRLFMSPLESNRVFQRDLLARKFSNDSIEFVSVIGVVLSLYPLSCVGAIRDFACPRLPLLGGMLHLTTVRVMCFSIVPMLAGIAAKLILCVRY